MSDPLVEHAERLARLEERINGLTAHVETAFKAQMDAQAAIAAGVGRVESRLVQIDGDITRYKGVVGGITLALSGSGVLLLYFKDWVLMKLGMRG